MRNVCLSMRTSLDGYVAGPKGELNWAFRSLDPQQEAEIVEWLRTVDTILIGRVTYLQQASFWPRQTGDMAELLNAHEKVVFSTTLDKVEWNNSRLATSSIAEEVASLKQSEGKDIYVTGGGGRARALVQLGLVDRFNLTIHPVMLGVGKPLFPELREPTDLVLTSSRTFDSGAVHLTYSRGER
jgi:dihydrofolate reductase